MTGTPSRPWQAALPGLESGALLHQAERRPSFFIERDDLAVKDGALGFNELRQAAKFGKLCGEVVLIARHQTHAAVFDESDGAVAVPLDFKQPCQDCRKPWRPKSPASDGSPSAWASASAPARALTAEDADSQRISCS